MGVKALDQEKVIAPFMGSPLMFIPGLDPLGVLNVSDLTSNKLLPGLTTITERIRYYSFYCWFFDMYSREIRIVSKKEQFTLLRRAEYLLALLAAKNQFQGIPGITKAIREFNKSTGTIDLKEGTGELTDSFEGSYWLNPRGVFGQNYVSSMVLMGMLREKDEGEGIYIRTDFTIEDRISGKQLAKAFQENAGSDATATFIGVLLQGTVTHTQLEILSEPFHMLKVPCPSEEQHLLWQFLIGPDHPKDHANDFYRRRTIQMLLQRIIEKGARISSMEFSLNAYHQQGTFDSQKDGTFTLWYYFQLDQFWHMASTGSLQAFLDFLNRETGGGAWTGEDKLIGKLALSVEEFLKQERLVKEPDSFNGLHVIEDAEESIVKLMNQPDSVKKIAYAMILLRKLLEVNGPNIDELRKLALRYQLSSPSNFVNSAPDLNRVVDEKLDGFIGLFIKKYVVLRHQWVALRKMNDTQTTEKFVREDGLIRFISSIEYGYSEPRLDTILGFLDDLQILESGRETLTALGLQLYHAIPG
jgi:hypothetical protein